MTNSENKNVNHPPHYFKDTGHEVIDVIHAWKLNYNLGTVIKYVARAGRKNPEKLVEDLKKAIFYLNDEVDRINNIQQNEES